MNASEEDIKATMKSGVLTVTLPKPAQAQTLPTKIEIKVAA